VTHSLEQALRYGDRLIMLRDGQLIGDWLADQRTGLTPDALRGLYGSAIVSGADDDRSDAAATP